MKAVKCVCGSDAVLGHTFVYCQNNPDKTWCEASTPEMPTLDAAIRVWNAMQEAAGKETAE